MRERKNSRNNNEILNTQTSQIHAELAMEKEKKNK